MKLDFLLARHWADPTDLVVTSENREKKMNWIFWALFLAAILHVEEEYRFDWIGRVGRISPWVTPAAFFAINALFLSGMAAGAWVGTRCFTFSLSMAALVFINVWFHVAPSLYFRSYFPGLFTALFLYLPLSLYAYDRAVREYGVGVGIILYSILLGAVWMSVPLFYQLFKRLTAKRPDAGIRKS